ncbi:MAG TPA: tripartite tricarboxylate transporter substrate binding protein [Candidatus Avidesulfovibrio excrementigallinarum]|nr:tripartite tricarboxylate transporter substrate binding protein [Candidatus Avidesulfovibrio excrementigallinarum]
MKRVFSFIAATLITLGLCVAPAGAAPKYPVKPINLLCVYGPGGAADLALRVVAEYATRHGFTMNVVNMPGGSGTQAAMQVLNTRADGYNVLFGSTGLVSLPIMKKVGYTIHSFTPVADITDMPLTFCVRTDSGITSFEQWMGEAKKNPGQYSYGSPGSITSQRQFLSVLIKDKFPDVSVNHVPYGSGHEVNTALLGNELKAAFGVPGTNKNYLQSGEFTLLAVTSPERLPEYPNVPTFAELYGDKYTWVSFHGIFVKKGTPEPIVKALSDIVGQALADPEVQEKFEKIGITADYKDYKSFATFLKGFEAQCVEALTLLGLI